MYACTVYVKIRHCKCYTIFPFPLIENQFSIKRTILTITCHGFPCGLVVRIQRSHRCGRGSIPRMGDFFFAWELFYSYTYVVLVVNLIDKHYKCDWILENQPNCHTRPIPFYWPSYWLNLYTTHTQCHYQPWLTGLLF